MDIGITKDNVLNQLDDDERDLVINFAMFLIKNRNAHTGAYYRFNEIRERMVQENPMTMDEIDRIIHQEQE